jgi:amidase
MSILSETSLDVLLATASDLQQLLREHKITSVQIVDAYREKIEKCNGKLHAVICKPSNLTEVAQTLDEERRQGKIRGPLHGNPIIVKVDMAFVI